MMSEHQAVPMSSLEVREAMNEEIEYYNQLQCKFRKACNQVILLNNKILDGQIRYQRAVKANRKSYRYLGRLSLATLEGIRNCIYEYAARAADELDSMQDRFMELGIMEEAMQEATA